MGILLGLRGFMYVYSLHIQKILHTIFSTILHIRLIFRSLRRAGTVEKYTFLCMFFLYNDYTSFNCDYAEKSRIYIEYAEPRPSGAGVPFLFSNGRKILKKSALKPRNR